MARSMFPQPPQLWSRRGNGAVGVSDDPVGETYWKVKNGIRLSGMPAYGKALSETELWQVSLLLSMANKPLQWMLPNPSTLRHDRYHVPPFQKHH